MPRGGHPRQVTIDSREYAPAPDSTVTIIAGGWTSEPSVTGNGLLHVNQNQKLGGFEGLSISISGAESDYEALQEVANKASPVPVTVAIANGDTYSGQLTVEGGLNFDAGEGTVELAMKGVRFEKI